MRTYAGSCHCGVVRFTLRTEAITTGLRCSCSICRRKGAIMSSTYFSPDQISVHGLESLRVYRFGDQMVNHYFCGACGTYPFHDATTRPRHYRVNLGCIDGLDPYGVALTELDRRDVDP